MKIDNIRESQEQTQKTLDRLFEQDDDALLVMEDEAEENFEFDKHSRKVRKAFKQQDIDKDLKEFERGLEQLSLLAHAMETGEFGILIDKRSDMLDRNDIAMIKKRVHKILKDNPAIDEANVLSASHDDKIKILSLEIQTNVEKWGSFLISTALAGFSIGVFATLGIATIPIVSLIGGSILSGLFFAAGIKQSKINKSVKQASKVLKLTQAWSEMDTAKIDDRSAMKKFFDFLMMKSPAKIKKEAIAKAEQDARKAGERFQEIERTMPKTIQFTDDDGQERTFQVTHFFVK